MNELSDMSSSVTGKRYRGWWDVEKCLNPSLDLNYKQLLDQHKHKRHENNSSCLSQNRIFGNSFKAGLYADPHTMRHREGMYASLDKARKQDGTAMTLLQTSEAMMNCSPPTPKNKIFEMQKIYYSNININV